MRKIMIIVALTSFLLLTSDSTPSSRAASDAATISTPKPVKAEVAPVPTPPKAVKADPAPLPPNPTPTPDPLIALLQTSQQADITLNNAKDAHVKAQEALNTAVATEKTAQSNSDAAWAAFMIEVNKRHKPVVPPSTLTTITVSPATGSVVVGGQMQFTAKALDQDGVLISPQPTITWTANVGTVTATGLFTAPATGGSAAVVASSGTVIGEATVTVTAPPPPPTPVVSNLRVLFVYDPMVELPQPQWSILTSPDVRTWLNAHCPEETGNCCPNGMCPLAMQTVVTKPCFRFIPSTADPTKDITAWQSLETDIQKQKMPWMRAWNEQGTLVIDQTWPATVADTITLLKKFGGN